MGQREKFSTSDLAKINKMYKCDNIETSSENVIEVSTNVDASTEDGSVFSNSGITTDLSSSTAATHEKPTNSNNYPLLNFLGGLWNAGK